MRRIARIAFRLAVILAITLLVSAGIVAAIDRGAWSLVPASIAAPGGRFEGDREGRGPGEARGGPGGSQDRNGPAGGTGTSGRGPRGDRPGGGDRQGRGDAGFQRPPEGEGGFGRGDREGGGGSLGWTELFDAARQMAILAAIVIVLSILWRPVSRRLRDRRRARAAARATPAG